MEPFARTIDAAKNVVSSTLNRVEIGWYYAALRTGDG